VQGSTLGPILFNIYLGELREKLSDAFVLSYADDSYVGISCKLKDLSEGITKLESIAARHIAWLTEMGMVINFSKTDSDFFTESEIRSALQQIKSTKAQGHDEIPSNVLKDLSQSVIRPLTRLFNLIIETGIIPKGWKVSRIVPVFKSGDKTLVSNYRPISNISSISKAFEKALITKLQNFLDHDILFGSHQHSYRPHASTTTACVVIQDYVASELDRNRLVLMYSADRSSAFDLLIPNLLVQRLVELNIPSRWIKCIQNYLTNRSGFVDVTGKVSTLKTIPFGCVQGSVLGPVLFNIYTNQLSIYTQGAFNVSYADDSYVGISCERDNLITSLNDLKEIAKSYIEWLNGLGMVINKKKTELIIFGYSSMKVNLDFGGEKIPNSDNIKILGVQFQSNLKWSSHVNKVIKKISSLSYSLRVLNCLLNRKQHKNIINSHVISQLSYALPIWGANISHEENRRLSSLMFKIVRLHYRDFTNILSNREICELTSIRSLTSIRILADCNLLHKFIKFPMNSEITLRLIQQTSFSARYPNRLIFFYFSCKKIGKTSFINRTKKIAERIPFEWLNLSAFTFKKKMKESTPIYLP